MKSPTTHQKFALVHNYMDNIGGAERFTLILKRELNCKLYASRVNKNKIKQMGFKTNKIKNLRNPFKIAPFKQQFSLLQFHFFKPKKLTNKIIICGDWAISAAVRNNAIWYVHSPTRELWDLNKYVRETKVKKSLRILFDFWVFINRKLSKFYIKKIPIIICNSNNVKKRIKKYLNRNSIVIHPPVDTKKYLYKKHKNYWLSVNRLIDHKRVELQIEAFSKMTNEKLIIVGSYENVPHFKEYVNKVCKNKSNNIEFKHWVNENKLIKLYSECKGFITTPIDEDFGLTAIEAMASGKPVIAPEKGGYKESIISGKTGILIKDINPSKIIKAVKEISKNPEKYKNNCLKQAAKFDTAEFMRKINKILKKQ